MAQIERDAIDEAIRRLGGDKRAAAKELGIIFSTLNGKAKFFESQPQ
jgi:transcriptional regulator with PAS, ATPase and Fis domain